MSEETPILEVYSVGPTTIVGFGGRDVLDHINIAVCRDEIIQLIQDVGCHTLAFDLTGVRLLPSGLLGLLTSILKLKVAVHLYNPSADIRDVLETTKLNTLMEVHDVEIPVVESKE